MARARRPSSIDERRSIQSLTKLHLKNGNFAKAATLYEQVLKSEGNWYSPFTNAAEMLSGLA